MIQFNPLSGYFESINFAQDNLHVLKAGDTMTGALVIHGSSDQKQLVVKANATQTNDLQDWQDSNGNAIVRVDNGGTLHIVSDGNRGFLLDGSSLSPVKNNWNIKQGSDGTFLFDNGGGMSGRFKLGGVGAGTYFDWTPDFANSYFKVQDNKVVKTFNNTLDDGSGNLGILTTPSYPLDVNGDVRFGTRMRFSNASGDGGTFAIIGLDSGTGKNLEIYDYAENGTLVRIYGANMSMNVGQWNSTSDPGSKSLGVGGSLYVTSKTGIGTTNPAGLLDVNASLSGTPGLTGPYVAIGASTFTDSNTAASGTATNMAFNSIAAPTLAASNTGVKTTNAYTLYIAGPPSSGTNETIANASGLGVAGNVIINPVETGTANSNGSQANTALWIAPTFTGAGTNMRGITVFPNANNIGSGGSFYGVRLTAAVNGTTDSNNNVYAFNGQVTCSNTSTVGTVYGLGLWTPTYNQTSTSSNAVGLQVQAQACTPSNTSTTGGYNTYGINLTVGNQGGNTSGTDTNYGVYIQGSGGTAGAGGTVNNYAIYSTSSAVSYFGGSVGLGTNNPQNQLHISSGSAVGLRIDGTGNTTTSATAGAATLPANPVGFLIVNIGGTSYKLPYYS